jgi:hypothetical protein
VKRKWEGRKVSCRQMGKISKLVTCERDAAIQDQVKSRYGKASRPVKAGGPSVVKLKILKVSDKG